jgi:hypothetical protein
LTFSIEVNRTGRCVSCSKAFGEFDNAIKVRVRDNMGYSIAHMCNTCMDVCLEHKRQKDTLMGAI